MQTSPTAAASAAQTITAQASGAHAKHALRAALATNDAMADRLRVDLSQREAQSGQINWQGWALLLSIEGRSAELRAKLQGCEVTA